MIARRAAHLRSPDHLFWIFPIAFMFDNLEVYQKAVDLPEDILALTEHSPGGYCFLADPLYGAALTPDM